MYMQMTKLYYQSLVANTCYLIDFKVYLNIFYISIYRCTKNNYKD